MPNPSSRPLLNALASSEAAATALRLIDMATSSIRHDPARKRLVVFTDFAFAALWLTPRLASLEVQLPGVEARILTAQSVVDRNAS